MHRHNMNQYSFKRNNVAFQKLMLNNIDFIEERGIKEEGGGGTARRLVSKEKLSGQKRQQPRDWNNTLA